MILSTLNIQRIFVRLMSETETRSPAAATMQSYALQSPLITSVIQPHEWMLLPGSFKRYLMNISSNLDQAFMYQAFPPGSESCKWTAGQKSLFEVTFRVWVSSGISPHNHWGLFSLGIPGKTGNQCRLFYQRRLQAGIRYPVINCENVDCLYRHKINCFRKIWAVIFAHIRSSEHVLHCSSDLTRFPGRGMHVGNKHCYASPVFQLLARTDELLDILRRQVEATGPVRCPFAAQLLDIRLQLVLPGEPSVIDNIISQLGFDMHEQQDLHEFFLLIANKTLDELDPSNRIEFSDLFQLEYTWTPDSEKECRDALICIELPYPDSDCRLDVLLASFLSQHRIDKFPRLITLHINRSRVTAAFREGDDGQFAVEKVMHKVDCPKELRLGDCQIYNLAFTALHCGTSAESGHYLAVFDDEMSDLCVDGEDMLFMTKSGPHVPDKISDAQICFIMYQSGVHIRTSFHPHPATHISQTEQRPTVPRAAIEIPVQQLRYNSTSVACNNHSVPPIHGMYGSSLFSVRPTATMSAGGIGSQNSPKWRPVSRSQRWRHLFRQQLLSSMDTGKQTRFLSQAEKLLIAHDVGMGAKPNEISDDTGRHRSTVGRFLRSPIREDQLHRKLMTEDETLRAIILRENTDIQGKRLSCTRLAKKIQDKYLIQISKETVRQIRRGLGMRFLRPIPQCDMTEAHKTNRVAFALDWIYNRICLLRRSPIIFSDESKICLMESAKRLSRVPGECVECEYLSRSQHPIQIMVWACVGVGFKSDLLQFRETCNQETYRDLLTEHAIFPELNARFGEFQYIFQQDNAPPHVARRTIEWLNKHTLLLSDWPAHSPDLNPIEIMWALMKARIDVTGIKTAGELFQRAQTAWNDITQETVDNVCSSFEARLRTVIHLHGNTLNGHWTLVHKVHLVIKMSNASELEEKLRELFQDPSKYHVEHEHDEPLLNVTRMEMELLNDDALSPSDDDMGQVSVSSSEEVDDTSSGEETLPDQGNEAEIPTVATTDRPGPFRKLTSAIHGFLQNLSWTLT